MAGFSQGGGVGLALANWMVDGDPGFDVWAMDVARYGDWATPALHQRQGARELFAPLPHPLSQRGTCRPRARCATTPIYDRLQAENAVFGDSCGLEHAALVRAEGMPSRRGRHVPPLQCASACRRGMPRGARGGRVCSRSPTSPNTKSPARAPRIGSTGSWPTSMPRTGRIVLSPMLNERGKLIGDFTIAASPADRFFVVRHRRRRDYHMRWFERAPAAAGVSVRSLRTECWASRSPGRKSRELLQKLVPTGHVDGSVSVHGFRADGCRQVPAHRRPHHVHRRPRLRDLGRRRTTSARSTTALRGGRGSRPRAFRCARAQLDAPGKELRQLVARVPSDLRPVRGRPRAFHRPRQGRLHRPRRGCARRRAAARAGWSHWPSTRTTRTRSATSRSGTTARWSAGSRRAATAHCVGKSDCARLRPGRARAGRQRIRGRVARRAAAGQAVRAGAVRSGRGPDAQLIWSHRNCYALTFGREP